MNATQPPYLAPHFALIGDLDDSRAHAKRAELQRTLRKAIARLNENPLVSSLSPLRLTAGDEIQAIGTNPDFVLEVVTGLAEAVAPVKFSWGLGQGPLETDIDANIALMDGPCFHRAREALERAKARGNWFDSEAVARPAADLLVALMNLMAGIRGDWTEKQATTVRLMREASAQNEVAATLGKSTSTISRALQAAKFERMVEGERAVRQLLEGLRP